LAIWKLVKQYFRIFNRRAEIANAFEWLTHPGSQQLGAKWVEVTKRRNKRN
jgi:hypothetical protein